MACAHGLTVVVMSPQAGLQLGVQREHRAVLDNGHMGFGIQLKLPDLEPTSDNAGQLQQALCAQLCNIYLCPHTKVTRTGGFRPGLHSTKRVNML